MCLISSYFHCLLPRCKGSHQELSKYIRSFQRNFGKEKFLYLNSCLQFNVIHLIYAVKYLPSNVIILITTKSYMNFLFLVIFANFLIFLTIIPLSGVYCEVMRWQPYFSYGIPIFWKSLCLFLYSFLSISSFNTLPQLLFSNTGMEQHQHNSTWKTRLSFFKINLLLDRIGYTTLQNKQSSKKYVISCYKVQTSKRLQRQFLSRAVWKKKFFKNYNNEEVYWFCWLFITVCYHGFLRKIHPGGP